MTFATHLFFFSFFFFFNIPWRGAAVRAELSAVIAGTRWWRGEAKHPHLICKQNLDEPRLPHPGPPVCRAQRHCKSQCCSSGLLCTKTRARPDASSTPTDVDGPPCGGAVRGVPPPPRRPPVPLRGIPPGPPDPPHCTTAAPVATMTLA